MIKPCEDRIDILEAQLAEANKRIRMLETANGTYATIERELVEAKKDAERMRFGLENCRLLAARHRKEDWALLILGFCAEAGVAGSVTR